MLEGDKRYEKSWIKVKEAWVPRRGDAIFFFGDTHKHLYFPCIDYALVLIFSSSILIGQNPYVLLLGKNHLH